MAQINGLVVELSSITQKILVGKSLPIIFAAKKSFEVEEIWYDEINNMKGYMVNSIDGSIFINAQFVIAIL